MTTTPSNSNRILSVDALRGFDMFLICGGTPLIVNFFKGLNTPLTAFIETQCKHANWERMTFHDIIMPLFIFIVGVAMVFSFEKRLANKKKLYTHVLLRVIILFILGMVYQGRLLDLRWDKLFFYNNTLQAIAVGYLGASLLLLLPKNKQVIVTLALLFGYWGLLRFFSAPGFDPGDTSPRGNFAGHIDNIILGDHRHGNRYTWVLSSMTFIVTTMLGVFCGHILRNGKSKKEITQHLLLFGLLCLNAGYLLHLDQSIIKKLWTSAFTLVSGGYCILLLALFYWVIDVLGYRKWSFVFVVIGANSIFAYMVFSSHFVDTRLTADLLLHGLDQWTGNWTDCIHSLGAFALIWFILYVMYKKKCFIKI